MHQLHHRIYRTYLEPTLTKVSAIWVLMVVILEQFAQHQEVKGRSVLGLVPVIKVGIAILMTAPIDIDKKMR